MPSLLTQIYGLFTVTCSGGPKKVRWKKNFMVLKNLKYNFQREIITFDLKGVGRNRRIGAAVTQPVQ